MPIYDYRCSACNAEFELLVRASALPQCPKCGSAALDKRVSAPVAPGRSAKVVRAGRRAAAAEGHLSHYTPAERRAAVKR